MRPRASYFVVDVRRYPSIQKITKKISPQPTSLWKLCSTILERLVFSHATVSRPKPAPIPVYDTGDAENYVHWSPYTEVEFMKLFTNVSLGNAFANLVGCIHGLKLSEIQLMLKEDPNIVGWCAPPVYLLIILGWNWCAVCLLKRMSLFPTCGKIR